MNDHLVALKSIHDKLAATFGPKFQLPEPSLTLDLDSRRGSERRLFNHLHQMCSMHGEAYRHGNGIKLTYLIDAYIGMVDRENPLGTYSAARVLLEFNAFLHEVRTKLRAKAERARSDWYGAGQEFFRILVQARYGTTNPKYREFLRGEGLSSSKLTPFHISDCIKGLSAEPEFAKMSSRYDVLCDFVHHNLSSQMAANAGGFIGTRAGLEGAPGSIVMNKPAPIIQFQFPIPAKAARAVEDTASGAFADAQASLRWLNETPTTPYDEAELIRRTGSSNGFQAQGDSSRPARNIANVGRNEPCPCGSGKKLKHCCRTVTPS
jgi:hypothetical protein